MKENFRIGILFVLMLLCVSPTACEPIQKTISYEAYVPFYLDPKEKYPMVLLLSPTGDGPALIPLWKDAADHLGWILIASKDHKNGIDYRYLLPRLHRTIEAAIKKYPVDTRRIIVSGMSGGGMSSHTMAYTYPELVSAIVVNTGMMSEFFKDKEATYPRGKVAVFLASPTNFRYDEMQSDKEMLDRLEWKTKWIEFEGGHVPAPIEDYMQAAEWINDQFKISHKQ